jgi:hypothetical protein
MNDLPEGRRPLQGTRWSLPAFAGAGAATGVLVGVAWGWMDYGRPEIGFMYGHVLGMALVLGVLGFALAAFRNWMNRNPLS